MSKFKEKFSELRNNTPRRVQWLLMAVAFIVVIILLTLLFSGNDKKDADIATTSAGPASLVIEPDLINWADTSVGETKEQTIDITATQPAIVTNVERHDEIAGYDIKDTCVAIKEIGQTSKCQIFATYAPGAAMSTKQTTVTIVWHRADEDETMAHRDKIVLTLGAVVPVIESKPAPQPALQPVVMPEPEPESEPVVAEEPVSVREEIVREVEAIAPPVVAPRKTVVEEEKIIIPDGCSDFAFPGYNNAGRQIGWIKPSGGAYYFHTFSDTDCSDPTGTYNPDNGIITDEAGKKIGTDADHIGFAAITSGEMPVLSNVPAIKPVHRATQNDEPGGSSGMGMGKTNDDGVSIVKPAKPSDVVYGTSDENVVTSSAPYDRTFILRQFKPIPATIVSDVRADIQTLELGVPVRATVDRNVYSDNGRTVILPTGTLMLGYVTGEVPGPYKTIGRMQIKWYQFIRPDGVEFNFPEGDDPYSADSQGRLGVPGRGSSDYLEQFFMPMLTAFVPAAVNLINPVADAFVNQIDLDNNTVVQSGTMRSSELAKNEIITAWNQVAQKLMVDMMDNTVPPFTIAAGTRITVYSPVDLQITCGPSGAENTGKKCAVAAFSDEPRRTIKPSDMGLYPANDSSWVGQSRQFQAQEHCEKDQNGLWRVKKECSGTGSGKLNTCGGYSYTTLKLWCDSLNYESKKDLQYKEYQKDQSAQYQQKIENLGGVGSQAFNEQILGVQYNADGTVQNPYESAPAPVVETADVLLCLDGTEPDANGCCTGEIYTDMGDQGFNCCPESGGDCFPPMF